MKSVSDVCAFVHANEGKELKYMCVYIYASVCRFIKKHLVQKGDKYTPIIFNWYKSAILFSIKIRRVSKTIF